MVRLKLSAFGCIDSSAHHATTMLKCLDVRDVNRCPGQCVLGLALATIPRLLLTYLLWNLLWRGSCQNGVEEIIINLFCLYTNLELWLLDSSLAKKFFLSSSRPGLRFFLLILRLRKDADSLKPALYILPTSSTAGDLPYPASRGSRSLLTNITKFWREAQPLK